MRTTVNFEKGHRVLLSSSGANRDLTKNEEIVFEKCKIIANRNNGLRKR